MVRQYQRNLAQLLRSYQDYLLSKVSKVRILGEADERELKDVFVELSIVDQRAPQRYAEFLGMMDSAMRRRLNPFANTDRDVSPEMSARESQNKRRLRPDELLRSRTKVIVTGAPGSGKTTLLKYLALQAQGKEKRLAVWLDLKVIDKPLFAQAETAAARDGTLILSELWLEHLKTQLSLNDAEIKPLRQHLQEKLRANELAVFLDGFDELQDEAVERQLNKCLREFASASHDNPLLISTRPYAQHKLGAERFQELEIEPLNQRQIETFLNCYYPNDAATRSLLKTFRERSSFRELLNVPLLLGVILRLHRENRFTDERLKLYETIIADLIQELDRSKSVTRPFKIDDERLRLDFLKFLAYERLLRDPLDEREQEASRIVFNYDLLKHKARIFLTQERSSHNPRSLADDVLATPLLREVGLDSFAFSHLTLQECLAAHELAACLKNNQSEALKILSRAYHNPTIVEMEVLPMMLGALADAEQLYAELEGWPESLTFTNLRLRARGLTYSAKIKQDSQKKLVDRLFTFILELNPDEIPYGEIVVKSFTGLSHEPMSALETEVDSLLNAEVPVLIRVLLELGRIGSDKAVDALISATKSEDAFVRLNAVSALGGITSEKSADALMAALQDDDDEIRSRAAEVMQEIGSDKAVPALISDLKHKAGDLRLRAVRALWMIGSDKAVPALIHALKDEESDVRWRAAQALGETRGAGAIEALISALGSADVSLRGSAAYALGRIGSEQALDALISSLKDEDSSVRWYAAEALGRIDSDRAIPGLIRALQDEDSGVRWRVAMTFEQIPSAEAAEALLFALNDEDMDVRFSAASALELVDPGKGVAALTSELNDGDKEVRFSAAFALGKIGSAKAIDSLIWALDHEDKNIRWRAIRSLGEMGSDRAVPSLISELSDDDQHIRYSAAAALGEICSKEAMPALISVMDDEDPSLRRIAAQALARIGCDKSVKTLISALQDEDYFLQRETAATLAQMEAQVLGRGLVECLMDTDPYVRMKAALVVPYYSNSARTLDQLEKLASTDPDEGVRAASEDAVARMRRKLDFSVHLKTEDAGPPVIDNESRELLLIGEAFKVAAEAGHIFRPTPNSDWGIDGEIEFKNEHGEASGQRVYLQLKSGDSYLRKRKHDGKEVFTVKPRHAEYWQSHAYPVLLVIRNSGGQTRWMNVTDYLMRHGPGIKQIEFQGEPFTAGSVKKMRTTFAR